MYDFRALPQINSLSRDWYVTWTYKIMEELRIIVLGIIPKTVVA